MAKKMVGTITASFLFGKSDELNQHHRRYSANQLRALLTENGFTVSKISYWNFSLFLPAVVFKLLNSTFISKFCKENQTDLFRLPPILNSTLKIILSVENWLILKGVVFPFGTSVVCIAKKSKG